MNRRPNQSRSGYESFSPQHTAHFTAAKPDTDFFEPRKKKPPGQRLFLLLVLLCALLLVINMIVNQFVHVSRVSVPVKGLSEAFEGYTLLHISDLKGSLFGPDQMLMRFALKDAQFDVVLLTGDMVSARGNAQPLYAMVEMLRELNPDAPIYFIAGDDDPTPTSMEYATGGSPFAPWVLGVQQRGAKMLSAPQRIEREGQTIWLTTNAQLSLDIDTMQGQFELKYLNAEETDDENAIELAKYNLQWLEETRTARNEMRPEDIFIALTHVPPRDSDILEASSGSLWGQVDLVLCGHYLGGLLRLPLIGALFIPSQNLPMYGILPGADTYYGLTRTGHTWIYTSPGLGEHDALYPAPFFRLMNPPTVTLLSLTPSSM